jgi:torulene dioxygenase
MPSLTSKMATSSLQQTPYNNYFVGEKYLKYVPPYFRDTPETTTEVSCVTKGLWPDWVNGTFMRCVYAFATL